MTADMSNAEIMTAADLTWRYVGPGQENLTYHPDRDTLAAWAELYTEDGALLLAMSRVPEQLYPAGDETPRWYPNHSELLTHAALGSIPTVVSIDELDMHLILDLETEDARRAS